MKSVLVISHGLFAKGMVDTAKFIIGDSATQLDYLCLEQGESVEDYGARLDEKLKEIDQGDGVVILADLYGGTPFNQAGMRLNEKNDLIVGANIPLLIDVLMRRLSDGPLDIDSIVSGGAAGVLNAKTAMADMQFSEDDE